MPDYGLKSRLLQDGKMIAEVKKINRSFFADWKLQTTGEYIKASYDSETVISLYQELSKDADFQEAERIVHASINRTSRLRSRVQKIITEYDNPTFCTLTFTDDVFAKTSAQTRRKYVTLFLKAQSRGLPYVANIDFGAQKGREHYHAVCAFRICPKEWEYGSLNVQKVRSASDDLKLSKYVSKLTNHAIKETARRNAIIYSR